MAREVIHLALEALRLDVRGRLWADFAAEYAETHTGLGQASPGLETLVVGVTRKSVKNLTDDELMTAIAAAIESGLEIHQGDFDSDRVEQLANRMKRFHRRTEDQFTPDERSDIRCGSNADRPVAGGFLRDRYQCSAETYVRRCEELWQNRDTEILKRVAQDYLTGLLAAQHGHRGHSKLELSEQLADIYRAIVAGGDIKSVDHNLAFSWGEAHLEDLRNMNLEYYLDES